MPAGHPPPGVCTCKRLWWVVDQTHTHTTSHTETLKLVDHLPNKHTHTHAQAHGLETHVRVQGGNFRYFHRRTHAPRALVSLYLPPLWDASAPRRALVQWEQLQELPGGGPAGTDAEGGQAAAAAAAAEGEGGGEGSPPSAGDRCRPLRTGILAGTRTPFIDVREKEDQWCNWEESPLRDKTKVAGFSFWFPIRIQSFLTPQTPFIDPSNRFSRGGQFIQGVSNSEKLTELRLIRLN